MKTPARLSLILLAGLFLAGCATKSAQSKPTPATVAALREPRIESVRDHWFRRDIDDKAERIFENNRGR